MRYVLNIVYAALLLISLPWLLFAAIRHGKYRQGWGAKLFGRVPVRAGDRKCVWLHAVSVGEVNLLKPLLTAIEQVYPDWECVISTTTRTGYELARQKYAPRTVFYCPLDFSWAVSTALRRIRPDVLLLAELELWPNLIAAAQRRGVRVAVVNGRLSPRSFRGYQRLGRWASKTIARIDLVAAQNEEYARRFVQLGAVSDRVHVTGSIKFDGAQTDRDNPTTRRLATLAGIQSTDVVLLAGSTQRPEEQLAVAAFRELAPRFPQLRLILVPRHPERFDEVAGLLDHSGLPWTRRSRLKPADRGTTRGRDRGDMAEETSSAAASGADTSRILLVDTVGELGAWWGTAHLAYVGGSLGSRGGQNMIEPAAYGAAVAFGPNTRNFRDVVGLMLAADAAEVVRSGVELTAWAERQLSNREEAWARGERARQLVMSQLGATRRTLALLDGLFLPGLDRGGRHRAA